MFNRSRVRAPKSPTGLLAQWLQRLIAEGEVWVRLPACPNFCSFCLAYDPDSRALSYFFACREKKNYIVLKMAFLWWWSYYYMRISPPQTGRLQATATRSADFYPLNSKMSKLDASPKSFSSLSKLSRSFLSSRRSLRALADMTISSSVRPG